MVKQQTIWNAVTGDIRYIISYTYRKHTLFHTVQCKAKIRLPVYIKLKASIIKFVDNNHLSNVYKPESCKFFLLKLASA